MPGQWQQADIPSSGSSAVSDDAYSDIAGAATTGGLTSGFTPRAAHVGKYIRVCASFKDQHPAPADEERCNIGAPVAGTSQTSGIPAAQDTSVDVGVGSDRYLFQLNDFAFKDADGNAVTRSNFIVEIITVPDRGRLVRRNGTILRGNEDTSSVIPSDFAANATQNLFWIPPPEAISITPGFTSFTYRGYSLSDTTAISSHGTVTINLVLGETTQQVAGGAPTVTGGMGASYAANAPLTASIYGVADQNGVDTNTLSWKWQEADAPSSPTFVIGAYDDIEDTATTGSTSRFTPRAAHIGKYIRVCASFKDQHPTTPADEERCSLGLPAVASSSLLLRLRLFLEGPLR